VTATVKSTRVGSGPPTLRRWKAASFRMPQMARRTSEPLRAELFGLPLPFSSAWRSRLVKKVSWEGVTCDYFHSVREVTMRARTRTQRVEFSMVKSGPSKESVSTGMKRPSPPCILRRWPASRAMNIQRARLAVLTTYTSATSSYGKESGGCQSCHMASVQETSWITRQSSSRHSGQRA